MKVGNLSTGVVAVYVAYDPDLREGIVIEPGSLNQRAGWGDSIAAEKDVVLFTEGATVETGSRRALHVVELALIGDHAHPIKGAVGLDDLHLLRVSRVVADAATRTNAGEAMGKASIRLPDMVETPLQQEVVVEGNHEIPRPQTARELDVELRQFIHSRGGSVQDPADAPSQSELISIALLRPGIRAENAEGVAVVQVGGEVLNVDLRGPGSASRLDKL
jgi:hypothetical protein